MAHPIFKPDSNKEYTATMLGGPYGDNDSKGPIQGKYGPQWKYLVRIGETPHYWYATPKTQEMIEKRGYDTPSSPFTILKRVEEGQNKGFELSGETYDGIFPINQPAPEEKATLDEPQSAPSALRELESRLITFSQAVNERLRGLEEQKLVFKKQIEALEIDVKRLKLGCEEAFS